MGASIFFPAFSFFDNHGFLSPKSLDFFSLFFFFALCSLSFGMHACMSTAEHGAVHRLACTFTFTLSPASPPHTHATKAGKGEVQSVLSS